MMLHNGHVHNKCMGVLFDKNKDEDGNERDC